MPIVISRTGNLYTATVSAPHDAPWTSPEPMTADALVDQLRGQGCHQTDIGDAFYEADPEWLSR